MTSPLPVLQYLVAFNNGPTDDPALITTIAAPGVLGATNVWTDITAYVDSHQINRGKQHELDQFEAGTCDLTLNNNDGRFYPWNTSGPYYGLLKPRKLLQVRATWGGVTYIRFTGQVNAWVIHWDDVASQFAEVQAADAFRIFNNADITSNDYAAEVLANSPYAYWRLNDPAGSSSAADSSGNNFTATALLYGGAAVFGTTGALPADPSTCVELEPATGGNTFIQAPYGFTLSSSTGISQEIWMSVPAADASTLVASMQLTFKFGSNTYTTFWTAHSSSFIVHDSGNVAYPSYTIASTNVLDGNFHHVVITLTTGWVISLYVDGVLQGTTTATSGFTATSLSVPTNIEAGGTGTADYQEWALYPTVLTGAQVAAHYNKAAFVQESTGSRIGHVADVVGWSSTARRIDAGVSQVQAQTSSLATTSALTHMQDCESTEAGALFIDASGNLTFLSRNTLLSGTVYTVSQETFGDGVGQIQWQPGPTLGIDDLDIYNEASGQRQGGTLQVVDDQASISEYGRTTWQPNGQLLGISDLEVQNRLQYVVTKYAEPVERLQSITCDIVELIGDNLVGQLLGLDLLYRVTVERSGISGTPFTQVGLIEGIQEQVTADDWQITFALDVADTNVYWVLGTGALGSTTGLAF